jgi:YegS/Rv2252/BmrU family lipid kinase
MKKCVVIYNPNSGKHHKKMKFKKEFADILSENHYSVTFYKSKYHEHIVEIVKNLENDIDLVISIGGDGTFNESVRGNFLREKRLVLAHLPYGTTNDVGTMYGYKKNPIEDLKLLMDGEIKKVDICTINDIPSIYVAGFGKYVNIPYNTTGEEKRKFGYLAYIVNGIKEFFNFTKLKELSYEIDGETYQGYYSFMLSTNSTRVAGLQNILKDIKLNDNKFEIVFCNIASRRKLINSIMLLGVNSIDHVQGFFYYKTSEVKIHFKDEKKIEWDIDGEKVDIKGPDVTIKIDRETRLMIPKKNIKKLFV